MRPRATSARVTDAAQPNLWNAATARTLGTLRLVREGTFPAPAGYPVWDDAARVPVCSPRDVFDLMGPYAAREVSETFWLLALDAQHRASEPIAITRGILNSALVHPREVFRAAMVAGAAALVLVHNHPSAGRYASFAEAGML